MTTFSSGDPFILLGEHRVATGADWVKSASVVRFLTRVTGKEIASQGEDREGRSEQWVLLQERMSMYWGLGGHTAYQKLPLPLYKLSGMSVVTAE